MVSVGSRTHAVTTKQCHENSLAFFVFQHNLLFLNFKNALCTEFTTLSTRKTCLLIGGSACWLALVQFSWFWPLASYCHESQLKLDSLEIRFGVRLSPRSLALSSLSSHEKYLIFCITFLPISLCIRFSWRSARLPLSLPAGHRISGENEAILGKGC